MPNPFFFAGKITNPNLFIGREKELKKIFGYLDTTHTGQIQHVSVVGARRIGKSSLLYHISQIPKKYLTNTEKYRFIYIDLDSPHFHTLNGLMQQVLELLEIPALKKPSLEGFYECIENLNSKKKVWTVLLMDEFEHLTQRNNEFKDTFFESLRSLGNNNFAGIITASQKPLQALAQQGKLTSPFFNIFNQIDLANFTDSETQTFLNLGRQSDQKFNDEECKQINKIAGNHPARLQITANLLYETKKNNNIIVWKDIKAQALKTPPFIEHIENQQSRKNLLSRPFLWLFWDLPQYMGNTLMVFIGRGEHTNPTADRMVGYVLIGILCGIIPWVVITQVIELFFK
ncbi:MAG: AAA family ATPase [Anaerolineales bacterium]|nr:AAA family ATPase [Anaerolineales bacterium]MBX3037033.1 AAA family ATPase [Anaerolineales bacterium]